MANTLPNPERVQIWNTFFHQAWLEAKTLYEKSHRSPVTKHFGPKGGTLAGNDREVLTLLVQCTLAIEARANHLIDELIENGKITETEGRAVQQLPARDKWFLLPRIAGVKTHLSDKTSPHQAIAEICAIRNNLVHVNFKRLRSALPSPSKMLALFRDFVFAVDDMNITLKRSRKGNKRLRAVGKFCTSSDSGQKRWS